MFNRRDFLKKGVGAVAAAMAMPAVAGAETERITATTVRTLGNTGVKCTLLGMGTGVKAWNGVSELTRKGRDAFMGLLEHAYAQGITYFDMADMYGAHDYMRQAMKQTIPRDKVTLLTKTVSKEADVARADIERFRKELDTDHLDVVLLHCMTDPAWPENMKPCMDALAEAKSKGVIGALGVSCHSLTALEKAADTPWVDVIMARINPYGIKMDGSPEQVVPILKKAHASGKGVLGIKIVGEGQLRDKIPESMKFALELGCIDAMPIGFLAPEEVDSAKVHLETAVASMVGVTTS